MTEHEAGVTTDPVEDSFDERLVNYETGEIKNPSEVNPDEVGDAAELMRLVSDLQASMGEFSGLRESLMAEGLELPKYLDRNQRRLLKKKLKKQSRYKKTPPTPEDDVVAALEKVKNKHIMEYKGNAAIRYSKADDLSLHL